MNPHNAEYQTPVFRSPEGRQRVLDHIDGLLEAAPFDYRTQMIPTSFGDTYVLEAGRHDRPALLLVHGSTANSAAWLGDIPHLAPHFRVLAVDVIGDAGHSAQTRPDMKSDGYAAWLGEVLDGMRVGQTLLFGNSLGAWISLTYAAAHPERVRGMVLLAAAGIAPIRVSFLFRLLLWRIRGGSGKNAVAQMIFGNDAIPDKIMETLDLLGEEYLPYRGAIPVLSDAELRRLDMPVLYIAGENDLLTNVPASEKSLNRLLPDVTVHRINAGHIVYNVMDTVLPFLLERTRAPR